VRHIVLAAPVPPVLPSLVSALETEGLPVVVIRGCSSAVDHTQMKDARLLLFEGCPAEPLDVDAIRRIRARWSVPTIVLASEDNEDAIVDALDAGADDYLVQPVSQRELVARIRTILRRFRALKIQDRSLVRAGLITLDLDRHTARMGDRLLHLPLREYQVLQVLAQNHDYIVTRAQLFEAVGGTDDNDPRTVTTYIRRLRAKIEATPHEPRHIITVRGLGYKLAT
jgi:two-component system response regulator RegX3